MMDEDLARAYDTIRGKATRRADVFAKTVSQYGVDTFGKKERDEKREGQLQERRMSRRGRRIQELKKEGRRLKAAVRNAVDEQEKAALERLVKENMRVMSKLIKAERHAENKRAARRTRKKFTEDPFSFAKGVFQRRAASSR